MHLTGAKFISVRNALLLGISFFSFALFIGMFEFSLSLKLNDIDAAVFLIGLFISLSWFLTTFLDLFWGVLIDRVGKWRAIIVGCVIFGISAFLFAFSSDIWVLFFLNLTAYLGFDVMYIALEGFLIDSSSKKYFNYSTSGFFSIWSAAYVSGPILAAVIISAFDLSSVYLFAIPLMFTSIVLFFIFFRKSFKLENSRKTEKIDLSKDIKYFVKLLKSEYLILFGIFVCTFWHATMLVGIPIYFAIDEGNLWDAALVATAFAFPFIFTDLIDGLIATNKHRRLLIITCGFLLGAFALFLFFLTNSVLFAMLFAFTSTIGVNFAWATFEIEAGLISQRSTSGKVESFFVFAKNLGWDIAPIVFGTIAFLFSTKTPFLVVSIGLLVVAIFFFLQHNQVK